MRYQLIEDQYPISQMCQVLQALSSGYYHWWEQPISDRAQANEQLVVQIKAIHQAKQRHPPPSLIHHADRGSQYIGDRYQAVLHGAGFVTSASRVGHCLDDAVMGSFFASLKSELQS